MSCRKDCLNCDAENVKTGTCGYCHTDLCEKCCREDFEDADSCCSNDAFDWCCKDCEEMNGEDEKVKCYGGCGYEFDDEELFDGDCECFNDQTKQSNCRKCDGCGICDNCWDSGKRIAGSNGEIKTLTVDDHDAPNIYPYKKCCDCEERKSCGSYKDDRWFCEDCYEEEPKPTCVVTGRKFILKIKNGKVVSKTQI